MLKEAYELGSAYAEEMIKTGGEVSSGVLGAVPGLGPLISGLGADEGKALGAMGGSALGQLAGSATGALTGGSLGALIGALLKRKVKSKWLPKTYKLEGLYSGIAGGGLLGTLLGGYLGASRGHKTTKSKAPKKELGNKALLGTLPVVGTPLVGALAAEKGKGLSTSTGAFLGRTLGYQAGKPLGTTGKLLLGGAGGYLGSRYGHGDFDDK